MKQIALIGKYGVGKTTLLKRIANLGYKILIADDFFKKCYQFGQPCYDSVKGTLGADFVNSQEVDKIMLRKIIQADISQLDLLEKLVHPILEQEVAKKKYHFVEIPIIYSKNANFLQYFDLIIELCETEKKRSQNIENKNVENSISELNDALNSRFKSHNSVTIYGDKLQNTQNLKKFLETLF